MGMNYKNSEKFSTSTHYDNITGEILGLTHWYRCKTPDNNTVYFNVIVYNSGTQLVVTDSFECATGKKEIQKILTMHKLKNEETT